MFSRLSLALCLFIPGALMLSGCQKLVECSADVTSGSGIYKGSAKGKADDTKLTRKKAVRDACMQMCAAEKAVSIDACASRCVADIEAGKVGAKIGCAND